MDPTFHQTRLLRVADLAHSWNATHREYNDGLDGGFAEQNARGRSERPARDGLLRQRDVPFYYGLYATFAMGDHYFSSVLGQTFPNRFFLVAGTSFGHISNDFPTSTADDYGSPASSTCSTTPASPGRSTTTTSPFARVFVRARARSPRTSCDDRPVLRRRGERRAAAGRRTSTRPSSATSRERRAPALQRPGRPGLHRGRSSTR